MCYFELILKKNKQKKDPVKFSLNWTNSGGELGIRTPDSFHYASFQDWCIQPLYQLSIFSFCLRQYIVYVMLRKKSSVFLKKVKKR